VSVEQREDMTLLYTVRRPDGSTIELAQDQVLHLRGLTSDAVLGRSVISDARDVIGPAFATQQYAGKFWANDATPGVVLKHPAKLSQDAATRLKDSWNSAFAGSGNARRTALLEEGMTIERLNMTAEDAQFLETRKLQRSEIAGLFRVPPHMIGDLERATFANIEHQGIAFVTHCIRPWLVRWEQAIQRDLITAEQVYFAEHAVEGLLRGDIKSRYDAYAVGRNWGWLSVNDIRRLENLNAIDSGDIYLQPLNMVEAGAPVDPPVDPADAQQRDAILRLVDKVAG
jgi:HK97 family phage portal protein